MTKSLERMPTLMRIKGQQANPISAGHWLVKQCLSVCDIEWYCSVTLCYELSLKDCFPDCQVLLGCIACIAHNYVVYCNRFHMKHVI